MAQPVSRNCRPAFACGCHGEMGGRWTNRTVDMERTKGRPSRAAFERGMVQAVPILQARLPYSPSLDRRPRPTVSPPGPASGPRDGGDGWKYARGFCGGDKMDRFVSVAPPPPTSPIRGGGFSPLVGSIQFRPPNGTSPFDGLRPAPKGKSLQWSDFREGGWEGVGPLVPGLWVGACPNQIAPQIHLAAVA